MLVFSFSLLRLLLLLANHLFSLTGMASQQLQIQVANMRNELFKQGYLDEQYVQLEELQNDVEPNFTEEIMTMFFTESQKTIESIEQDLVKSPLDFEKLDYCMHKFKGRCASIGAAKVKHECQQYREHCQKGNIEGCKRSFEQLKKEYAELRNKMETYFQMVKQAEASETPCEKQQVNKKGYEGSVKSDDQSVT